MLAKSKLLGFLFTHLCRCCERLVLTKDPEVLGAHFVPVGGKPKTESATETRNEGKGSSSAAQRARVPISALRDDHYHVPCAVIIMIV